MLFHFLILKPQGRPRVFLPQFIVSQHIVVYLQILKALTAQQMKSFIEGLLSKCDQICRRLRIRSHLLKKSLMENFIFCAVIP